VILCFAFGRCKIEFEYTLRAGPDQETKMPRQLATSGVVSGPVDMAEERRSGTIRKISNGVPRRMDRDRSSRTIDDLLACLGKIHRNFMLRSPLIDNCFCTTPQSESGAAPIKTR
jgi:hypothetical protein